MDSVITRNLYDLLNEDEALPKKKESAKAPEPAKKEAPRAQRSTCPHFQINALYVKFHEFRLTSIPLHFVIFLIFFSARAPNARKKMAIVLNEAAGAEDAEAASEAASAAVVAAEDEDAVAAEEARGESLVRASASSTATRVVHSQLKRTFFPGVLTTR